MRAVNLQSQHGYKSRNNVRKGWKQIPMSANSEFPFQTIVHKGMKKVLFVPYCIQLYIQVTCWFTLASAHTYLQVIMVYADGGYCSRVCTVLIR